MASRPTCLPRTCRSGGGDLRLTRSMAKLGKGSLVILGIGPPRCARGRLRRGGGASGLGRRPAHVSRRASAASMAKLATTEAGCRCALLPSLVIASSSRAERGDPVKQSPTHIRGDSLREGTPRDTPAGEVGDRFSSAVLGTCAALATTGRACQAPSWGCQAAAVSVLATTGRKARFRSTRERPCPQARNLKLGLLLGLGERPCLRLPSCITPSVVVFPRPAGTQTANDRLPEHGRQFRRRGRLARPREA